MSTFILCFYTPFSKKDFSFVIVGGGTSFQSPWPFTLCYFHEYRVAKAYLSQIKGGFSLQHTNCKDFGQNI